MAKITRLPSMAVIRGFKHTLDFYVWNGINCVRSWPRSPGHARTPPVEAGWPAFTFASQNWQNLSPPVQEAYRKMSAGLTMTGRDIFMKLYITKKYTTFDT